MDNVLVTGASRGLGLAIAGALAASNYQVIAIAREMGSDFSAAERRAADLGAGALRFVACDLSDIEAIPKLVSNIRDEFGPIYGLVNNAAISFEGLLATMPNSQIERLLRVNTLAPIILTKYAVRSMMSQGRGRVVNVSSIVASTGYRALSVYAASKSSLIGFTKSMAREVGKLGITVNAVAPGFMDTKMTSALDQQQRERVIRRNALGRLAELEDVAEAVRFLVDETGRNITGAVITIDAGGSA